MQHGWTARFLLGVHTDCKSAIELDAQKVLHAEGFVLFPGSDRSPLRMWDASYADRMAERISKACRIILRRSASSKEPERRAPSKATEFDRDL